MGVIYIHIDKQTDTRDTIAFIRMIFWNAQFYVQNIMFVNIFVPPYN